VSALLAYPWLAVAVPVALALVAALLGSRGRLIAPWLAAISASTVLAIALSSLAAVAAAGHVAEKPGSPWLGEVVSQGTIRWFAAGDMALSIGWAVDGLTAVMLTVVGVVALAVVVFSAGYMHGDKGWVRYFALLSLFAGSMSLLVIADSFTGLFIGWELVGACSYLLIGFWYEKPSAAAAAVKAFLTTRVGDVGLLIGLALLWGATGSLGYEEVLAEVGTVAPLSVMVAAVCLAIGAMGKSAQFPLHAWLPDAMEGPTPVSALIHAATMVAAGVFLVARVWPLFEAAPTARLVLMTAGAVSAFGAALAALAQRDIKKVLAYSTISQLGFMFTALGAGAMVAAFFHLVAHAAFKALLFLASGSVIHGASTQDLHEMGGLRKAMPVTFATWVVGVLALAGVPPLAGFFSKDAVLEGVLHSAPGVAVLLFAAAGVTAVYSARATRLAFFGTPAAGLHAHESPASMTVPLLALAVPAAGLGFLAASVSGLLGHEAEPLQPMVAAVSVGLALLGGVTGWLSAAGPEGDTATARRLGGVWTLLAAAYRYDALVDRLVVKPAVTASRALWAFGDRLVADGAAHGLAALVKRAGARLSAWQTGDAQDYSTAIAVGVAAMLALTVWLGRW